VVRFFGGAERNPESSAAISLYFASSPGLSLQASALRLFAIRILFGRSSSLSTLVNS